MEVVGEWTKFMQKTLTMAQHLHNIIPWPSSLGFGGLGGRRSFMVGCSAAFYEWQQPSSPHDVVTVLRSRVPT